MEWRKTDIVSPDIIRRRVFQAVKYALVVFLTNYNESYIIENKLVYCVKCMCICTFLRK